MTFTWDYRLVALSVFVAIAGSYLGLDLAGRMNSSPKKAKRFWFFAGAVEMGLTIWSMHFIGMLAFILPMPISYDAALSIASLLVAATGAGVAFSIISRKRMGWFHLTGGAIAMGLAIVNMHYIGMASMIMPAVIHYDPLLFALSVLIAVLTSAGAMWMAFHVKPGVPSRLPLLKFGSALLMGIAISGMHYVGMLAASYEPTSYITSGLVESPSVGHFLLSDLLVLAGVVFGVVLLLLNARTASEREAALHDLTESEARFSGIFYQAMVGIFKAETSGRITLMNQRFMDITGLSSQAFSDLYFQELIHPQDLEYVMGQLNQALETCEPVLFEHRCLKPTGEIMWGSTRITPILDERGRPVDLVVVVQDITQPKLMEVALEESRERFRLLVEEVKDYAIYWLDPSGNVEIWNKGAERIFGYASEEIINRHFSVFFHNGHHETSASLLEHAKNEGRLEVEFVQKRRDGSCFDASITITPIRDEQGSLVGFSNITRDITEENRAKQDLLESHAMLEKYVRKLEQSNQELEQFAAIASHDLQAPLRKVIIYSNVIQDTLKNDLPSDVQEYLGRMQRAISNMQNLISDLLALSRIHRKGQPFHYINLGEILREVFLELEEKIQQVGARIEVDNMCFLEADPLQIRQLFLNLLDNALKFHMERQIPFIYINAQVCDKDSCEITVQDNGIGFDEKYMDRIFAVFERLHSDARYQGTGMGLAICKKIVERHGGSITAKSQPNHGSTFIITLPIRQAIDKPGFSGAALNQVQ